MMNLPEKWFARILGGLIIAALLFGLFALRQCGVTKSAKTQATLEHNQGSAAMQSGGDAANTVGNRMALDRQFEEITEENNNAIRNAKGSDAPVDPAVRDAGLAGLCKRAAYSGNPKCVRNTPAR